MDEAEADGDAVTVVTTEGVDDVELAGAPVLWTAGVVKV